MPEVTESDATRRALLVRQLRLFVSDATVASWRIEVIPAVAHWIRSSIGNAASDRDVVATIFAASMQPALAVEYRGEHQKLMTGYPLLVARFMFVAEPVGEDFSLIHNGKRWTLQAIAREGERIVDLEPLRSPSLRERLAAFGSGYGTTRRTLKKKLDVASDELLSALTNLLGDPKRHESVQRMKVRMREAEQSLAISEDSVRGRSPATRNESSLNPRFVGRSIELAMTPTPTSPLLVTGMPGVGKSSFVSEWAFRREDKYERRIYLDVQGYSDQEPLSIEQITLEILRQIRPSETIRQAKDLERVIESMLQGSSMLIVFDNVSRAPQVLPLLRILRRAEIVITSRSRLTELISLGARLVALEPLDLEETRELALNYLGPERAAAEDDAIRSLTLACEGLPLLLSIVLSRAHAFPARSLQSLVDSIKMTGAVLKLKHVGSTFAVEQVVQWSYDQLSPLAQFLWCYLACSPIKVAEMSILDRALTTREPNGVLIVDGHKYEQWLPERFDDMSPDELSLQLTLALDELRDASIIVDAWSERIADMHDVLSQFGQDMRKDDFGDAPLFDGALFLADYGLNVFFSQNVDTDDSETPTGAYDKEWFLEQGSILERALENCLDRNYEWPTFILTVTASAMVLLHYVSADVTTSMLRSCVRWEAMGLESAPNQEHALMVTLARNILETLVDFEVRSGLPDFTRVQQSELLDLVPDVIPRPSLGQHIAAWSDSLSDGERRLAFEMLSAEQLDLKLLPRFMKFLLEKEEASMMDDPEVITISIHDALARFAIEAGRDDIALRQYNRLGGLLYDLEGSSAFQFSVPSLVGAAAVAVKLGELENANHFMDVARGLAGLSGREDYARALTKVAAGIE